jgi:hypothetical protein
VLCRCAFRLARTYVFAPHYYFFPRKAAGRDITPNIIARRLEIKRLVFDCFWFSAPCAHPYPGDTTASCNTLVPIFYTLFTASLYCASYFTCAHTARPKTVCITAHARAFFGTHGINSALRNLNASNTIVFVGVTIV